MIATRLARSNTKREGVKTAAPDVAELLVDTAADVEAGVEFVESADTSPNGVMITVELFTHWSAGNRVALALKVMSAHYFVQNQQDSII
jgi:hypothetical protein